MATTWPPRTVIRKSSGLRPLEAALYRSGLGPVAGVDEVGRGACAGPLVVAACVLGPSRLESLAALDDSKKLTEKAREKLYPLFCRYALAYHVGFSPGAGVDSSTWGGWGPGRVPRWWRSAHRVSRIKMGGERWSTPINRGTEK